MEMVSRSLADALSRALGQTGHAAARERALSQGALLTSPPLILLPGFLFPSFTRFARNALLKNLLEISSNLHIRTHYENAGLLDSYEGDADVDLDGIPNFEDLDSDGDGEKQAQPTAYAHVQLIRGI